MSSSPASNPKSPDITEKSKKYDRQLRLWGDHGQTALELASVCLINATATGTETLKSLVLAGLGAFTIVDNNTATEEDVGNNFFLTSDCVGECRGAAACRLLRQLNPDVRGGHAADTADTLLDTQPDRLCGHTVVIATQLSDTSLTRLAEYLWSHNVPLLVCRSYGLLGAIRLQVKEHLVIESHPDSEVADLRLLSPFQALSDFLATQQLAAMDRRQHGHAPYPVVLATALQLWRTHHAGADPTGYAEKRAFKQSLSQLRLCSESGAPETEENFDEAEKAVNTALAADMVPTTLQEIFDSEQCDNLTEKSADFWVLSRALREFVSSEGDGRLPVRGPIPDMFADSERYVQLQNIYRDEARRGAQLVLRRVQSLLETLGRPAHVISEQRVRRFCRNTHALRVQRGSPIASEMSRLRLPSHEAAVLLQSPDSELSAYALLRSAERFRSEFGSAPGSEDQHLEIDVIKLKGCLNRLLSDWGCPHGCVRDEQVQEMCRYGGAELHSVAAFIGGCAAHEVIKLVTGQYAPIDNTFVYNAAASTSSVLML